MYESWSALDLYHRQIYLSSFESACHTSCFNVTLLDPSVCSMTEYLLVNRSKIALRFLLCWALLTSVPLPGQSQSACVYSNTSAIKVGWLGKSLCVDIHDNFNKTVLVCTLLHPGFSVLQCAVSMRSFWVPVIFSTLDFPHSHDSVKWEMFRLNVAQSVWSGLSAPSFFFFECTRL